MSKAARTGARPMTSHPPGTSHRHRRLWHPAIRSSSSMARNSTTLRATNWRNTPVCWASASHTASLPARFEAAADLDTPSFTSEAISIAVGQRNVSVPPIQMAVAVAALANGGTVYKPSIVKQVGGFDGAAVSQTFEPVVLNTIDFRPGVLEEIQAGMCGTTTNKDLGTAYIRFDNAPYRVCGKTGTAQTARYPNAWFVAYGPAEDPEIAVAVVVSQSLEGSQVSAPIVRRIFDWYFSAPEYEPFPEWWAQGLTSR
ncbi:MAG: hypothetical protein HND48_04685 [Chloroflexi bacterium]|nr:hypothetical protein [Chloroflexota bacterium]